MTVEDTDAPTLAPLCDPGTLWPPNHELVTVTVQTNAADSSGIVPTIDATATSDEDPLETGSGHTYVDILGPYFDDTDPTLVYFDLRSERSGKGDGRTYTITSTATDGAGNVTEATCQVVSPHDRRR